MWTFLTKLFDTRDFPRRWECGNWEDAHGYLHISSDIATAIAYTAIPCVLAYFVLRRRDLAFPRVFWIFCVFIFACGSVHLVEAVIFWQPVYRLSGLLKAFTAVVSWATVVVLVQATPQALALRSPAELKEANLKLEREIAERKRIEKAVLESDERLNLALKSSGVGTWSWDIRTDTIIWDDYLHPLFGLEPKTFPGHYEDFVRMLHSEDRERVTAEVARSVEQDAEYDTEFRVVWPDDSIHHIAARGKVYRDENNQPQRMTGVCWDITQHKQAEQALEDSEALYSSLVESLPMHVLRKDLDGRITFANKMFCSSLGKPLDEIIGKTDLDLYPQELAEKYRRDDRQVSQTGEVFEDVEENQTGEELRYFQVLKSPVRDAEGTIIGTQAAFWDVSRRKTAEAALEEERFLLHTLMHHLPDAIYFKDTDSRFLRVSQALANQLQLSDPAEAEGKTDSDFFTEEYARQAREDEQALMKTGRTLVGKEEKPVWPDGHESWISTTKSLLRDKQGRIRGTFGISRDITVQKRAEQALRESERRTRLIVDTALDAFVSMDADGLITGWNAQAEVTFGWPREEVVGRSLAETIIPASYRDEHTAGLQNFLSTGEGPVLNTRIELIALHRDGDEFPVEMTISPIRLNETFVFNAFVHDITDRRRAQTELQQAKEAAESASRAKSDFLANMSHEIRTPMNAIMGMTELVLDTTLESGQREYLTTVQQSAESLLAIIDDILDFSKIEAGKLELKPAEMELREILGDTMKLLAVRAHREELELACHIAPEVPTVVIGDSSRLRQIVVNLVGNALKFTEQGEVVLDVACESRTNGEVVLHFRVSDTGIGIPQDKLAVIFESFEQADSSTTRRFAGTGLGLAISSSLVKLMQGRIWVESEVDRGSTFHFTARFGLAPDFDGDAQPVEIEQIRGTRVLVVDDNATNRRILEEMLGNWNMQPTTVSGASAALEALRQAHRSDQSFPLVLTDVNMPDRDGFSLVEEIKRDDQLSSTIIMMLTSGDRPDDVARCNQLGVAAYLMKPIKQSELLDAIATVLGFRPPKKGTLEVVTSVSEEPHAQRSLNILLAEDSLANQRLAVGLLEKRGHRVTVAINGVEAIAMLNTQPFDLILMDVQMPEMDGLEATARIRKQEQHTGRQIPIVAMTAHAMQGDRRKCLEAGMNDYIAKPVRAQQLYETISRVMGGFEKSETNSLGTEGMSEGPEGGEIDWSAAMETVRGDRELLADVTAAALEEIPRLVAQLDEAIRNGDAATAQRAAHTIRGVLRTFGVQSASQVAGQLEEMGRLGKLDGAAELFDTLRQKMDKITQELLQMKDEG